MQMKIVAANGFPTNTVGWLAPVVRDRERCFILGASKRRDFAYNDLSELAKQKLVTLVTEKEWDLDPNACDPPLQPEADGYSLSLPYYVFYFNPNTISILEENLGENNVENVDIGICCAEVGNKITVPETNSPYHFRLVSLRRLTELLKRCFDLTQSRIYELLMEYVGGENAIEIVNRKLEPSARVLYEFAFDKNSAREAIILRSVTTATGSNLELVFGWILGAAQTWGIRQSVEWWKEKINSFLYEMAVRKRVAFGEAPIDRVSFANITPTTDTGNEDNMSNKGVYYPALNSRGEKIKDVPSGNYEGDLKIYDD